jgi:hypothetical protein
LLPGENGKKKRGRFVGVRLPEVSEEEPGTEDQEEGKVGERKE